EHCPTIALLFWPQQRSLGRFRGGRDRVHGYNIFLKPCVGGSIPPGGTKPPIWFCESPARLSHIGRQSTVRSLEPSWHLGGQALTIGASPPNAGPNPLCQGRGSGARRPHGRLLCSGGAPCATEVLV